MEYQHEDTTSFKYLKDAYGERGRTYEFQLCLQNEVLLNISKNCFAVLMAKRVRYMWLVTYHLSSSLVRISILFHLSFF